MATTTGRRKPAITITRSEHEKLVRLAEIRAAKGSERAEELLAELDRARIVDDRRITSGVVRMGSAVSYSTDAGEARK
jgi:regulator of nucleoside diphosphate kinase